MIKLSINIEIRSESWSLILCLPCMFLYPYRSIKGQNFVSNYPWCVPYQFLFSLCKAGSCRTDNRFILQVYLWRIYPFYYCIDYPNYSVPWSSVISVCLPRRVSFFAWSFFLAPFNSLCRPGACNDTGQLSDFYFDHYWYPLYGWTVTPSLYSICNTCILRPYLFFRAGF